MRSSDPSESPMLHVVVFSLAEPVDPVRVARMRTLFHQLADRVPGAELMACGPNTSESTSARDWHECCVIRFENESARTAFLQHPLHEQLGREASGGYAARVVVHDVMEHAAAAAGEKGAQR